MRRLGAVSCAVLVLAAVGLLPPAASQEPSHVSGDTSTLESGALSPEMTGQCQESGRLMFGAAAFCWYCDVEYCGCAVVEGCILIYSCACSSIECRRSCQYEECVA